MTALVGTFEDHTAAERAVVDLIETGVPRNAISFLGTAPGESAKDEAPAAEATGTVTGMGLGAFAGGALGALVGVGALAIPAIGPIIAAGALGTALAGGAVGAATGIAAGGLVGSLVDAGLSEENAAHSAEAIGRGGAVLLVEVTGTAAEDAANVLRRNGAIDIRERTPAAAAAPTSAAPAPGPGPRDDLAPGPAGGSSV
jgi:hypothetical protein